MAITGRRRGASQRSNDSSCERWIATQPAVGASSQLCKKIPEPGAPRTSANRVGVELDHREIRVGHGLGPEGLRACGEPWCDAARHDDELVVARGRGVLIPPIAAAQVPVALAQPRRSTFVAIEGRRDREDSERGRTVALVAVRAQSAPAKLGRPGAEHGPPASSGRRAHLRSERPRRRRRAGRGHDDQLPARTRDRGQAGIDTGSRPRRALTASIVAATAISTIAARQITTRSTDHRHLDARYRSHVVHSWDNSSSGERERERDHLS